MEHNSAEKSWRSYHSLHEPSWSIMNQLSIVISPVRLCWSSNFHFCEEPNLTFACGSSTKSQPLTFQLWSWLERIWCYPFAGDLNVWICSSCWRSTKIWRCTSSTASKLSLSRIWFKLERIWSFTPMTLWRPLDLHRWNSLVRIWSSLTIQPSWNSAKISFRIWSTLMKISKYICVHSYNPWMCRSFVESMKISYSSGIPTWWLWRCRCWNTWLLVRVVECWSLTISPWPTSTWHPCGGLETALRGSGNEMAAEISGSTQEHSDGKCGDKKQGPFWLRTIQSWYASASRNWRFSTLACGFRRMRNCRASIWIRWRAAFADNSSWFVSTPAWAREDFMPMA